MGLSIKAFGASAFRLCMTLSGRMFLIIVDAIVQIDLHPHSVNSGLHGDYRKSYEYICHALTACLMEHDVSWVMSSVHFSVKMQSCRN